MFRMNGNRKRPSKAKSSNQVNQNPVTESKTEYQEDFNEIILNDLVPSDKKEEFGLEDTPKTKKNNGLKINLGLGGKKSSKRPSSKKKHQANNEQEISDNKTNNHKSKVDNSIEDTKENTMKHNNKVNKNKKTNNHKEVEENKQTQNKKHKKHSLSHAQPKEKEVKDVTEIINEPKYSSEVIEESTFKQKTSKKVHHSKRKKTFSN